MHGPTDGANNYCSRLLYICGSPLVPAKIGPARRNQQIVQQLSRFFHITVLGVGTPDEVPIIQGYAQGRTMQVHLVAPFVNRPRKFVHKVWLTATRRCDYLPARLAALHKACARLLKQHTFDAVVLSSPLLYTLPLPHDLPLVADTHNVEFDLQLRIAASAASWPRRFYAARQAEATRNAERAAGARADLLLATSERDRELFARSLAVRTTAVIRNGIDLAEFQPTTAASGEPVVLFTGLMSYFPNQAAIRWFLQRVWPRILRRTPSAHLVVAGAAPPRWLQDRASEQVTVTGAVRDMRPLLAQAHVVIAPLTIGGGTRVKILEAQAMCRPVVSTRIGAEGLDQRHRETILLADSPEAFAAQVSTLLADREGAQRIAVSGREHIEAHFDWQRIGLSLAQLLSDRLGLQSAQASALSAGGQP